MSRRAADTAAPSGQPPLTPAAETHRTPTQGAKGETKSPAEPDAAGAVTREEMMKIFGGALRVR